MLNKSKADFRVDIAEEKRLSLTGKASGRCAMLSEHSEQMCVGRFESLL